MNTTPLASLLSFLEKLKSSKIYYVLSHHREDAVMVEIAVPGERWEVEFFTDGSVEVERFKSDGKIFGEAHLGQLFKTYSD